MCTGDIYEKCHVYGAFIESSFQFLKFIQKISISIGAYGKINARLQPSTGVSGLYAKLIFVY